MYSCIYGTNSGNRTQVLVLGQLLQLVYCLHAQLMFVTGQMHPDTRHHHSLNIPVVAHRELPCLNIPRSALGKPTQPEAPVPLNRLLNQTKQPFSGNRDGWDVQIAAGWQTASSLSKLFQACDHCLTENV